MSPSFHTASKGFCSDLRLGAAPCLPWYSVRKLLITGDCLSQSAPLGRRELPVRRDVYRNTLLAEDHSPGARDLAGDHQGMQEPAEQIGRARHGSQISIRHQVLVVDRQE